MRKRVQKKEKLEMHIEVHLDCFSHECRLCDREFKTTNSLQNHKYLAHKEKPKLNISEEIVDTADLSNYSMDGNDQAAKLRFEILKRIEKVTNNGEGKIWKCKVCSKTMKKKDHLSFHVETHLEFTHQCPHCDKVKKTKGALAAHISTYHRG